MNKDETIYDQIKEERRIQDQKWGGIEHDDTHSSNDWVAYIAKHLGRAADWDYTAFRRHMIRVAALAVAAIEWVDRRIETLNKEKK